MDFDLALKQREIARAESAGYKLPADFDKWNKARVKEVIADVRRFIADNDLKFSTYVDRNPLSSSTIRAHARTERERAEAKAEEAEDEGGHGLCPDYHHL